MLKNLLAWLGAAILGGGVVAALGGAADDSRTVEAQRIVLKAPDGSARVLMSCMRSPDHNWKGT